MTLTVRLDPTLETALERYCANTGTSKSHVVQESLAAYLMTTPRTTERNAGLDAAQPSPAFQAFADAGLVGAIALPLAGSADKAAVRAHVQKRTAERAQPSRRKPA